MRRKEKDSDIITDMIEDIVNSNKNKRKHKKHRYSEKKIKLINEKSAAEALDIIDSIPKEIKRIDNRKDILKYAREQSQLKNFAIKNNKKSKSHIVYLLNSKYRGCKVNVLVEGTGILSGEVVFNFEKVLALKNQNTIVFINTDFIAAFY